MKLNSKRLNFKCLNCAYDRKNYPLSINRIIDNFVNHVRKKFRTDRFRHLTQFLRSLPSALSILDVGGTEEYWEQVGYRERQDVIITILNLDPIPPLTRPGFCSMVGDARDMHMFRENQFDLVFSNSVIEHVGDFHDQKRMAREIQRVGRWFYVQTPNYFFPVEPHYLIPFLHFLPFHLKKQVLRAVAFSITDGRLIFRPAGNEKDARFLASRIRLLKRHELKSLFPTGTIWEERLLGLTKSLIIYGKS